MRKLCTKKTAFRKSMLITLGLISLNLMAQTEAPTWVDYSKKKESKKLKEATLSDYSYSGYHFSEKEISDISNWKKFDVTDYGAMPNDGIFDDAGIRAAVAAAIESNAPAVVYLPAGKYLVSDNENVDKPIVINKSNIVLKGAGSGVGGTEIFADKTVENPADVSEYQWRFRFIADNSDNNETITTISKRINRGDFTIEVHNANKLSVGQTVELYNKGVDNLEANMPGLTYNPIWKIGGRGVTVLEKHIIESINENKVTFKNPVQYNITADISGAEIREFNTIEEVGIEDILFTSGWANSPEIYAHHASDFVDYAFRAIRFDNVKNGWIRNCEIKDWNESLQIDKSIAVTVKNLLISGKQGHTSYYARYSYGILFENCEDIVPVGFKDAGGMGHGAGMRWSTVNTVFKNCKMQKHQSIDCHGYHPYSNLLDNVTGGTLYNNGGAESAFPNSGPYMTFWNFVHESNFSTRKFNFWDLANRRNYTYINPILVGFQSPGENIILENEGLNELQGEEVYPKSLFDAQLQLRLYGGYMSASSSKDEFLPVNANDGKLDTKWVSENGGQGSWLMLDIGYEESVYEVVIKEEGEKIGDWTLEGFVDGEWIELKKGTNIGANKTITFDQVKLRKFRFTITSMKLENSDPATIVEFEVTGSISDVGIYDLEKPSTKFVNIYPNPIQSDINIDIELKGNKQISIFKITGDLVWFKETLDDSVRITKNELDLASGVYVLVIIVDRRFIQSNKIVVQ